MNAVSLRDVMSNPQLPLGLSLKETARFESFFPGQNREIFQGLQLAAEGKGELLLYIAAADGLGKTHLLQAACHHASQCQRSVAYLPLQELLDLAPAVLEGLEQMQLVCLDDVHAIAGNENWEQALFDLFNRLRDSGSTLLARGLELPDDTAQFLLRRFPRDLPSLFALLDTLDAASLVEQRRLTIPFVKTVLDR